MVYAKGLISPACDVTTWVRDPEGQQYPGLGKGPHTETYVASKRFGKKTQNLKCRLYQLYYTDSKTNTLHCNPSPDVNK